MIEELYLSPCTLVNYLSHTFILFNFRYKSEQFLKCSGFFFNFFMVGLSDKSQSRQNNKAIAFLIYGTSLTTV